MNYITAKTPEEGRLLIIYDKNGYNGLDEKVFTGYWSDGLNCATQFKDPDIGYKYRFTHWMYADELLKGSK